MFKKKKKQKELEYFQNVFIEFSNGKTLQASIPAIFFTEEDLAGVEIKDIKVTKPKKMPEGTSFSYI